MENIEILSPYPEQVAAARERLAALQAELVTTGDPALAPLTAQLDNHLKHVSYRFQVAGGIDDYPYDIQRSEPFPAGHTEWALERAERFFDLLEQPEAPAGLPRFSAELGVQARAEQQAQVRHMLDYPLETYDDFTRRRERAGDEAEFPEMGWTIKALASDLATKPEVLTACEQSPVLRKLRARTLETLAASIDENRFAYGASLDLIEDAMGFFDLAVRINDPETPPPYHTARFEYNWHALRDDPEHTILPTMASLNLTDLIRLRGVQVGLIGVSTDTLTVDGYPQTPYEFFHHDVDHTRRMHQETLAAIEREGMTPRQYAEQATELMLKLLPAIDVSGFPPAAERSHEQQADYDRRVARMLVLFEVLHEDAYDCSPDSIADAILRAPMEKTPFEREVGDDLIEYYTDPRASVLAHVYRKLAHTFYDLPEDRGTSNWTDYARNRISIANAAADLYRLVSDDPIADDDLLNTCMQLVSSDEGFSNTFLGNIAHDIRRRAIGRDALRLMVARPLNVNAAIRHIRKLDFPGMKIHSLFGYSALEYEQPDLLEQTILRDLEALDPAETAIAIGATPYGIGRMYPLVKALGFQTLGIVASKALGLSEECAEGVDKIVVVNDSNWGGYRYSPETKGLLSPTTRVFLGASDSIAAYGGGHITAVTLQEAHRRQKSVSYTPFEMSHFIAKMLQQQSGNDAPINYYGPAVEAWQKITEAA
ncbi:MAG: hypothetical protein JWN38_598 [Candidatus Saccharibacteria bacterium]|nr:hypothetical protein [Candidatus Saccharibacteria bacterium]